MLVLTFVVVAQDSNVRAELYPVTPDCSVSPGLCPVAQDSNARPDLRPVAHDCSVSPDLRLVAKGSSVSRATIQGQERNV